MASKPTIQDVAAAAGVSTATVGRVLYENGYVAEKTRIKVEQALKQLAFRPNLVARSLRRQRSRTIGHLLTNLVPNPFFAGVEAGVEEAAAEQGYHVIVWNTMADPERERAGVEMFLARRVDAMIFTTPRDIRNVQAAKASGTVVVQVERPVYVESHLVLVDNYVGSVEAVEHLVGLGHRHIAFAGRVAPPDLHRSNLVDHKRLEGYRDVLARHDILPEESWLDIQVNNYSVGDGYKFARRVLEMHRPVTAILAACDILAAGALQAIHAMGLRVPQDVSIIGFDNTFAPFLAPPLATVDLNVAEIGRRAAQMAISALEDTQSNGAQHKTEVVSSHLVLRSSTGPGPGI